MARFEISPKMIIIDNGMHYMDISLLFHIIVLKYFVCFYVLSNVSMLLGVLIFSIEETVCLIDQMCNE